MTFLENCFPDDSKPIIVLGNFSERNELLHIINKPIYLSSAAGENDSQKYQKKNKFYIINFYDFKRLPATQFFVDIDNEASFIVNLHQLRNSIWWNVNGFFFY